MQFRVPLVAFAFILTIAACSRREPVAPNANAAAPALPAPAKDTAPSPAGGPPQNETAPAAAAPAPSPSIQIPAAFQGRWGLTPADCTSALGDAKGLLVINPGELRFYESRAVPSSNVQADRDSLSGDFQFTGEGQSWTKFEALKLNKQKLTRTETNPTASFTYAKC
jgi:hypothetical protein